MQFFLWSMRSINVALVQNSKSIRLRRQLSVSNRFFFFEFEQFGSVWNMIDYDQIGKWKPF